MTARDKILKHLQDGGTLTALQAWKLYGTSALSQHCTALRARGYKIGSYLVKGARYSRYYISNT